MSTYRHYVWRDTKMSVFIPALFYGAPYLELINGIGWPDDFQMGVEFSPGAKIKNGICTFAYHGGPGLFSIVSFSVKDFNIYQWRVIRTLNAG